MAISHYKDSTIVTFLTKKSLGSLYVQCMVQHTVVVQYNGWICQCPNHQDKGLRNPSGMRRHKQTESRNVTLSLFFLLGSMMKNPHAWHTDLDNTLAPHTSHHRLDQPSPLGKERCSPEHNQHPKLAHLESLMLCPNLGQLHLPQLKSVHHETATPNPLRFLPASSHAKEKHKKDK